MQMVLAQQLPDFVLTRMKWLHQERAQLELKKDLTAADRPTAWRLLFNDAASYNVQTGKGGVNASIVLEYDFHLSMWKVLLMHSQDFQPVFLPNF